MITADPYVVTFENVYSGLSCDQNMIQNRKYSVT